MSAGENKNAAGADAGIWQYLDENFSDAVARLDGWVDLMTARRTATQSRRIDAAVTSVQVPVSSPVSETRTTHARRLADLCRCAGVGEPDILADTLMLLSEGVRDGDGLSEDECRKLNRICKTTIAAFCRS